MNTVFYSKIIKCPTCQGLGIIEKHEECPTCLGEEKIESIYAIQIQSNSVGRCKEEVNMNETLNKEDLKEGERYFYSLGDSNVWWECTIKCIVPEQGVVIDAAHVDTLQFNLWRNIKFKPYKKEIDEKEETIEQIAKDINNNKHAYYNLNTSEVNSLANHLYDLGYVKVSGDG